MASSAVLRERCLTVAAAVLPRELDRVHPAQQQELAELCAAGATASSSSESESLAVALGESFVQFLLHPPGDATPMISSALPETEVQALAELYWRCLVAVALMPTPALESLAKHHKDLTAGHLAQGPTTDDATAPTTPRRRLLVEAVLPRFSMVCTSREDAEAAARRRVEIEEMKKQAAAEAAAEEAAEATTAAAARATASAPAAAAAAAPASTGSTTHEQTPSTAAGKGTGDAPTLPVPLPVPPPPGEANALGAESEGTGVEPDGDGILL